MRMIRKIILMLIPHSKRLIKYKMMFIIITTKRSKDRRKMRDWQVKVLIKLCLSQRNNLAKLIKGKISLNHMETKTTVMY